MSPNALEEVTVFCDGSCLGNPGPGGWAALLVMEREGHRTEKLISGHAPHATNNKMELQAAISGLRALKRACRVLIVTDSNYVVQGMTSWRFGWEKNGWKNSHKKPVENRELWQDLIEAQVPHEARWQWVRGHAGHPENERVDAAAHAEAAKAAGA